MIIISTDERTVTTVGECENCHKTAIVRPVKSVGWSGEGRGWFRLCFGPRVVWKEREGGQVFESPAEPLNNAYTRPPRSPLKTKRIARAAVGEANR